MSKSPSSPKPKEEVKITRYADDAYWRKGKIISKKWFKSPKSSPKEKKCRKCGDPLCGCEAADQGVRHYGCAHFPDTHTSPSLKPKSNQDKEPTSGDISSVKKIKFIPTDKIYTGSYMEAYEDGFKMLKEQLPDLIQEVDSKAYLKGLKDGGILLELHIRKALAKQKREAYKEGVKDGAWYQQYKENGKKLPKGFVKKVLKSL